MRTIAHFSSDRHSRMPWLLCCAVLGVIRVVDAELPSQQKTGEAANKTTVSATAQVTTGDKVQLVGSDPEPMAHGTNVPSVKLDVQVLDAITGKPVLGAEVSSTL